MEYMIRKRPKIPKTEIERYYLPDGDRKPADILYESDIDDDED